MSHGGMADQYNVIQEKSSRIAFSNYDISLGEAFNLVMSHTSIELVFTAIL